MCHQSQDFCGKVKSFLTILLNLLRLSRGWDCLFHIFLPNMLPVYVQERDFGFVWLFRKDVSVSFKVVESWRNIATCSCWFHQLALSFIWIIMEFLNQLISQHSTTSFDDKNYTLKLPSGTKMLSFPRRCEPITEWVVLTILQQHPSWDKLRKSIL